jgi:hypothetical protein
MRFSEYFHSVIADIAHNEPQLVRYKEGLLYYVLIYLTFCSLVEIDTDVSENSTTSLFNFLLGCLVGLLLDAEDGISTYIRSVDKFLSDYTASHLRR